MTRSVEWGRVEGPRRGNYSPVPAYVAHFEHVGNGYVGDDLKVSPIVGVNMIWGMRPMEMSENTLRIGPPLWLPDTQEAVQFRDNLL